MEYSELVRGHLLELVDDFSVFLVHVITMGNGNVDSKHVELHLLVLDEVEQVLELGTLDLAS